MAWLVPSTINVEEIRPYSEQGVVKRFIEKLSDNWVVIPQVHITIDGKNAELDVVLVSKNHGVYFMEVKGGEVWVTGGQWWTRSANGEEAKIKNPIEQIISAKHQLAKRLIARGLDLRGLFIRDVVVLPDVVDVSAGGIDPAVPREATLTKVDLEDPEAALVRIGGEHPPVEFSRLMNFVQALRPTVKLNEIGGRFHLTELHRVDQATLTRLGALVALSTNQRVLATGAAGTGKTFLAERWARRCAERGERTLLVCYNVPLAEDLAHRLEGSDVDVHSFHRLARELLLPVGFEVPQEAESDWWDTVPARMLVEHREQVTRRYDSIVVDEGQDFRQSWWDALDTLFAPDGPRRLLVVADPLQTIYAGPWVAPENMMLLPLETNVRSTAAVGRHVKRLGGADPNSSAPEGFPVRTLTASHDTVVEVVAGEVIRLTKEFSLPPTFIAILARHRALRDLLLGAEMPVKLARWEHRDEDTIVCETIHRVKGLERLAIILVDLDETRPRELDYIGSSRAVLHLTVVTR